MRQWRNICSECKGNIVLIRNPLGQDVRVCEKCGLVYEWWLNQEYIKHMLLKRHAEQEKEKMGNLKG